MTKKMEGQKKGSEKEREESGIEGEVETREEEDNSHDVEPSALSPPVLQRQSALAEQLREKKREMEDSYCLP